MRRLGQLLRRPFCLSGIVALALTILLYGDALTLPLFSDDLVQIPWLESISWTDLWISASPYGFYRPIWYSLWRVLGAVAGGLRPLPLHLANLILHWVAAWLVGVMAAHWISAQPALGCGSPVDEAPSGPDRRLSAVALVATAVFAAFPFARQAVAWPGAVYNPLVSALASGAVILYDRGRSQQKTSLIVWSLLLSAMAPLAYEGGLMIAPMLVAVEAVGWLTRRWAKRLSLWPLLATAAALGTIGIWSQVRPSRIGDFGLQPHDLTQNIGYVMQGLVYPVAPLGQALASITRLSATAGLWIVGVPTLAVIVLAGSRSRPPALLLGVAWFGLFALPPLVTMEADWFALAPRFLYTTAGGIALVWATACAALYDAAGLRHHGSTRAWLATVLLAALLVAPAASFVRQGMRLYKMAGGVIWDAARAGAIGPEVLFVNLPRRITPLSRTYPLGYEGITPLPQRVTADQLVYVNTRTAGGGEAVAFGVVAPEMNDVYAVELHGREVGWEGIAEASRGASVVYLTEYSRAQIRLRQAGGPAGPPGAEGTVATVFGGRIGVGHATAVCTSDGQTRLAASWHAIGPIDTDVTVFAHLVDTSGPDRVVRAQADGYPLLGMRPFWLFREAEAVRDVRYFTAVPAGLYTIRVGVWEQATGRQWTASDGDTAGTVVASVSCP